MPLSWNEIRNRALAFSNEWHGESSERAESQSFWNGFFDIFGVSRRRIASFEKPVRSIDGKDGYIDLLWKGLMLVEHKSHGKNLDRAYRKTAFNNEAARVSFLFDLYQQYTTPLLPKEKRGRGKTRRGC